MTETHACSMNTTNFNSAMQEIMVCSVVILIWWFDKFYKSCQTKCTSFIYTASFIYSMPHNRKVWQQKSLANE